MAEETEIHPDLLRLNELVAFCEKRVARALGKLAAAQREKDEADEALVFALMQQADWIKANPDPQMELI